MKEISVPLFFKEPSGNYCTFVIQFWSLLKKKVLKQFAIGSATFLAPGS